MGERRGWNWSASQRAICSVTRFRSGKSSNRAQSNIEEGEQVRIKVGNHVETNVAPRARRKNRPRAPRGAATTVTMLEAVLKEGSNSGSIVLDPFLDSGTTLLAAERIGRVCRGMEMDAARVADETKSFSQGLLSSV
jgi:DNA modification methylase